jgi:hypothetical protein
MFFVFFFRAPVDDTFFFVLLVPREAFVERPCRTALLFIAWTLRIDDRLLLLPATVLRLELLLLERWRVVETPRTEEQLRLRAFARLLLVLPVRVVDDRRRILSVIHVISGIIEGINTYDARPTFFVLVIRPRARFVLLGLLPVDRAILWV